MRYLFLVALLLVGCSTSDPIRVGEDRYMISTTSYTGLSTRAGQIERAMNDANDFCARKGKVAQMQGDGREAQPPVGGQPAVAPVSESVVFSCVTGAP